MFKCWKMFLVIVLLVLPVSFVFADGADQSSYYVDLQGAKRVSEWGYFYFEIRNIASIPITVEFEYPSTFFFKDKGKVNPVLESDEIMRLHFQAPLIDEAEKEYIFFFKVGEFQGGSSKTAQHFKYVVTVIDLQSQSMPPQILLPLQPKAEPLTRIIIDPFGLGFFCGLLIGISGFGFWWFSHKYKIRIEER